MSNYKKYYSTSIFIALSILSQLVAIEAKADAQLEIIGVYQDSTSTKGISPEITLYKQDNKLAGTWSYGFPNLEHRKGFPNEVYPLENINIAPNGYLTFNVLWDMYSRVEGREKMYHHFTGYLLGDNLQGKFSSDWPSLSPGTIKAVRKTSTELKRNINDYVLAKQQGAFDYLNSLDKIIQCQNQRNQLPEDTIEITGFWSKVVSNDGLHEWGYDVVLFKVGNTLHGWLEDYEGFLGDGGTKFLISDIKFDNKNLSFIPSYAGKFEGAVKGSQLELHNSFGGVMLLNKVKKRSLPKASDVWKQYQMLRIDCK